MNPLQYRQQYDNNRRYSMVEDEKKSRNARGDMKASLSDSQASRNRQLPYKLDSDSEPPVMKKRNMQFREDPVDADIEDNSEKIRKSRLQKSDIDNFKKLVIKDKSRREDLIERIVDHGYSIPEKTDDLGLLNKKLKQRQLTNKLKREFTDGEMKVVPLIDPTSKEFAEMSDRLNEIKRSDAEINGIELNVEEPKGWFSGFHLKAAKFVRGIFKFAATVLGWLFEKLGSLFMKFFTILEKVRNFNPMLFDYGLGVLGLLDLFQFLKNSNINTTNPLTISFWVGLFSKLAAKLLEIVSSYENYDKTAAEIEKADADKQLSGASVGYLKSALVLLANQTRGSESKVALAKQNSADERIVKTEYHIRTATDVEVLQASKPADMGGWVSAEPGIYQHTKSRPLTNWTVGPNPKQILAKFNIERAQGWVNAVCYFASEVLDLEKDKKDPGKVTNERLRWRLTDIDGNEVIFEMNALNDARHLEFVKNVKAQLGNGDKSGINYEPNNLYLVERPFSRYGNEQEVLKPWRYSSVHKYANKTLDSFTSGISTIWSWVVD